MNHEIPLPSPEPSTLKDSVLEKIQSNSVSMRSKSYFILKVIGLIVLTTATLITSSLIISFITFSIGISDRISLLGFGWLGLQRFLLLFPWHLGIFEIILIVLLERLVRHFRFGYRSPILYLLAGIAIASCTSVFIINRLAIHDHLLASTEHNNIPVLTRIYAHIRRPSPQLDVFHGTIIQINDHTFFIANKDDRDNDADDKIVKVVVPPTIEVSTFLKVGDYVFVAGDWVRDELRAYGIRRINN